MSTEAFASSFLSELSYQCCHPPHHWLCAMVKAVISCSGLMSPRWPLDETQVGWVAPPRWKAWLLLCARRQQWTRAKKSPFFSTCGQVRNFLLYEMAVLVGSVSPLLDWAEVLLLVLTCVCSITHLDNGKKSKWRSSAACVIGFWWRWCFWCKEWALSGWNGWIFFWRSCLMWVLECSIWSQVADQCLVICTVFGLGMLVNGPAWATGEVRMLCFLSAVKINVFPYS